MLRFPEEIERSREMRRSLEREFEYANRICRFWLEFEKDRWLRKSKLHEDAKNVAMALHTQACRQLRSVVEECSRCEAFGANIAARGLFETVLALAFVLKERVHIVVRPIMGKNNTQKISADGTPRFSAAPASKQFPKRANNLLKQELRANLYVANFAFAERAMAQKCDKIHGLRRMGKWFAKQYDPATIAHYEKLIGPEWTSILKESNGYSGLNVRDLARLLHPRLLQWYHIIYALQSSMVHGASALQHTEEVAERTLGPAFLSTEVEVAGVLQCGSMLFRICMAFLQEEIGFGCGAGTAIWQLGEEFREIYR